MNATFVTITMIITVTIVLIVWDIYVALNNIPNRQDTISGVLMEWSKRFIALPYISGIVVGHLFIPKSVELGVPKWAALSVLWTSVIALAIVGLLIKRDVNRWPWYAPVTLVCGLLMGHFFWPQIW
jgi:hypothetical protein